MKKRILALSLSFLGMVGFLNATCITTSDSKTKLSDTTCYNDGGTMHYIFHDGVLIHEKDMAKE